MRDCGVAILGGGLAGLTLALQLKKEDPDLSIVVLEKRDNDAPTAKHKVGESTVELGTHYLREVLGLASYLDEHQLPKHGLRFFFPSLEKGDLASRVELGTRDRAPVPSHQIDRGLFENELVRRAREQGVEVLLGTKTTDVSLADSGHDVSYVQDDTKGQLRARWVVDATGRGCFLKRKLGFAKPMDHAVNAVWFRINSEIDIDDWAEDASWKTLLKPGLRRLGTIHLMDSGYWVWVIPLVSGATSFGIVADPEVHPFDEINRFDRALEWLGRHEPKCAEVVAVNRDALMDFHVLKHFAHHTKEFYSKQRWGVTGESGAFLDPFYSPGTDLISLSNTWLSDLILRENQGEDIRSRARLYQHTHRTIVDNWLSIYRHAYPLMGKTQLMLAKIFWDFATYWSVLVPIFVNRGFTNLDLLQRMVINSSGALRRLGSINQQMQDHFQQWAKYDTEVFPHHYADPLDVTFLAKFNRDMEATYTSEELVRKLDGNLNILDAMAKDLVHRMNARARAVDSDAPPLTWTGHPKCTPEPNVSEEVGKFWLYEKPCAATDSDSARRTA